ncbi:hypothetical protein DNHGIG_09040 [Collibacillus ludicampi]|uniref:Uncharacterized protein n=1 Tax=Collibacillus ludicampi TaxID=2771369 RepID=A0AAV4LC15_9BACL|nr:hypothetical protein [Collibacillus ludicampi]GIM45355.1 hypothetical protein DNHGIG_09040 [Collibacillus ludicampi]
MLTKDMIHDLLLRVVMLKSLSLSDPLHTVIEDEILEIRRRLMEQGIELADHDTLFHDVRVKYLENGEMKEAHYNKVILDAEAKAELRYRFMRLKHGRETNRTLPFRVPSDDDI